MNLLIILTPAQIRVVSSLFTNLAAGWLLGTFVTQSLLALTGNVVLGIVCLVVALQLEELL